MVLRPLAVYTNCLEFLKIAPKAYITCFIFKFDMPHYCLGNEKDIQLKILKFLWVFVCLFWTIIYHWKEILLQGVSLSGSERKSNLPTNRYNRGGQSKVRICRILIALLKKIAFLFHLRRKTEMGLIPVLMIEVTEAR